jgi:ATP-dependent helicase IRC3
VIASVQTIGRPKRLAQLPGRFDTIVVVEAHHATAATYRRIVETLETPLLVGFTATAERADKTRLEDIFDELVYERGIEWMIRNGYLCNVRGKAVELESLDLKNVKRSRGDYQAEDLADELRAADAVEHVVGAYAEHAPGRKALAFAPTVALAGEIASAFVEAGVPAEVLSGKTPADDRRDVLRRFAAGEIRVIANVGVLTEGFDEPSVDCVIVAAPTRSRIRYVQMIGRGLRLFPDKHDCLVLDLAGASSELSLSVPAMFGLRRPIKDDETITEAIDRQADEDAAASARDTERRKRARERKRRARDIAFFDRDRIAWLRFDGRWATPAGEKAYLVLDPTGETWRVLVVERNRASIAARGLDLGYAQGVAEERLRASGAVLADRDAPWRRRPVSDAQRAYATRQNIDLGDAQTMGDASDRIGLAEIRERMARLDRAERENGRAREDVAAAG